MRGLRAARALLVLVPLALAARAAAAPTSAPREWSRVLLDDPDALCLDGSPGAFYILPGVGAGASTFVVHLQGGGWCYSLENCRARAFDGPVYAGEPSLGSSRLWGPGPCTPALVSCRWTSPPPPPAAAAARASLLSRLYFAALFVFR